MLRDSSTFGEFPSTRFGSSAGQQWLCPAGAEWYVIQTKRYWERQVLQYLTLGGHHAFLPLIEVTRRHRTQRVALLEPLFPGYLFVQMASMESDPKRWDAVRWCPGVRLILGTDDTPCPVLDGAVEAIQDRVRDLGFVRQLVGFASGSRVRFRTGPLADLEAVFDRDLPRAGRVRVLLELLGQQRSVEVDSLDLASA